MGQWLLGLLLGALQALASVVPGVHRKEQPVEPLLDGYQELKNGFVTLTENLTSQLSSMNQALAVAFKERKALKKHYGKQFGVMTAKLDECNKDRLELRKWIEDEKEYTHDRIHFFDNYLLFLETDLEAIGIEPHARKNLIEQQRRRHEEAAKKQSR